MPCADLSRLADALRRVACVSISPAMGLLVATAVGMIVWVVLWALGAKAFDAWMVGVAIVLVAATTRTLARFLPGREE